MPEVKTPPQGGDRQSDRNKTESLKLDDAIRHAVLKALGSPTDLFKVDVRRLWDGHYRINVWTGRDANSERVSRSYFVRTDEGGAILSSIPQIAREYP